MLQQDEPEDYVIATGAQHSVREFIDLGGGGTRHHPALRGSGVDEIGIVERVTGDDAPRSNPDDVIVRVDPRYFRPAEVETLLGDASKAMRKARLGAADDGFERDVRGNGAPRTFGRAPSCLLKSHGLDVPMRA